MGFPMQIARKPTLLLIPAFFTLAAGLALADERSPANGTPPARQIGARQIAARSVASPSGERTGASGPTHAQPQLAQIDSHGRYPFGQFLGGYRYPFNYPYYRYTPRRYSFGNGPYGPYGSNYGGYYSGNRY